MVKENVDSELLATALFSHYLFVLILCVKETKIDLDFALGLLSQLVDLTLFQFIALMKAIDSMIGIERARKMITEIYKETETRLIEKKSAYNLFLMPIRDLKSCQDSFLSFKEYTNFHFISARWLGPPGIDLDLDISVSIGILAVDLNKRR